MAPYHAYCVLYSRDHFLYVPSQWETMLNWKAVSHWLGSYKNDLCNAVLDAITCYIAPIYNGTLLCVVQRVALSKFPDELFREHAMHIKSVISDEISKFHNNSGTWYHNILVHMLYHVTVTSIHYSKNDPQLLKTTPCQHSDFPVASRSTPQCLGMAPYRLVVTPRWTNDGSPPVTTTQPQDMITQWPLGKTKTL